jgi:hypothetical protein
MLPRSVSRFTSLRNDIDDERFDATDERLAREIHARRIIAKRCDDATARVM